MLGGERLLLNDKENKSKDRSLSLGCSFPCASGSLPIVSPKLACFYSNKCPRGKKLAGGLINRESLAGLNKLQLYLNVFFSITRNQAGS